MGEWARWGTVKLRFTRFTGGRDKCPVNRQTLMMNDVTRTDPRTSVFNHPLKNFEHCSKLSWKVGLHYGSLCSSMDEHVPERTPFCIRVWFLSSPSSLFNGVSRSKTNFKSCGRKCWTSNLDLLVYIKELADRVFYLQGLHCHYIQWKEGHRCTHIVSRHRMLWLGRNCYLFWHLKVGRG